MPIACTRPVSASIGDCQLTHLARRPIDLARARAEHAAYEAALGAAGFEVRRLPARDDLPDAVFVEDTAVVLDEVAVIARPGAQARRAEVDSTREALAGHRPLAPIVAPGTLDGGDVLVLERDVLAGLTSRTNQDGIDQLSAILSPYGYRVRAVPVSGCLHLKSAVTRAGPRTVALNPNWVDARVLDGWETVLVDAGEPGAANVLWLGAETIVAAEHPRMAECLAAATGVTITPVPAGELALAEGGVTCGSLILR